MTREGSSTASFAFVVCAQMVEEPEKVESLKLDRELSARVRNVMAPNHARHEHLQHELEELSVGVKHGMRWSGNCTLGFGRI